MLQALDLLCETARSHKTVSSKRKESKASSSNPKFPWLHMDESSQESLDKMCSEIVRVIDKPISDSNASLKVVAVSALEDLANGFPYNSIFNVCLRSVTRCESSGNLDLTSSCLRTTASLTNVLGPKALAELPRIMENVKSFSEVLSNPDIRDATKKANSSGSIESYLLSVLTTLEVVVDKLGGFLNPYLTNIIDLLVLRPQYISGTETKVESKTSGLRKLLAERIPVSPCYFIVLYLSLFV